MILALQGRLFLGEIAMKNYVAFNRDQDSHHDIKFNAIEHIVLRVSLSYSEGTGGVFEAAQIERVIEETFIIFTTRVKIMAVMMKVFRKHSHISCLLILNIILMWFWILKLWIEQFSIYLLIQYLFDQYLF